ncbi:MAG: thiamine pyrophosphate-dependent enzyme [Candidatus Bathyarchaeia archaeon]
MAYRERNIVISGSRTCPGCAGPLATRLVYNVLGRRCIHYGGGGCGGSAPRFIPTFGLGLSGAVSGATGIVEALKALGKEDITVVAWGGDGATVDLCFDKLSAAASRNDNMMYFCCDNEAFMNTGVQVSQSTPFAAWTRTTVPPEYKKTRKKNTPMIMALHYIPYVATVTIANHRDFIRKVKKAKDIEGFRYFHILQPCPTGWRYDPAKTIEISRLAVQSGVWPLYEIENGDFRLTYKPKERVPVMEYMGPQRRFRHVRDELAKEAQRLVDEEWEEVVKRDGASVW